MQVTIEGDIDGYMKLHCRHCDNDFKVNISEYENAECDDMTCPYCGLVSNRQDLIPQEIIDEAINMAKIKAMHEFQNMLSETFKNSKIVKHKPARLPEKIDNINVATQDTINTDHLCPTCGKTTRVINTSSSAKIYCCYCGELI